MSYSRRQLYALGEPLGACVTRREGGKIIYGGGGGSDGGGSSTSVTQASIAPEFKPLAALYTKQATNIANTPYQAYTGQRYANLNGTQNAAIGAIQNRALNGSATMNNAESNLNQMMSGGSNPYLDGMVNKAQANVLGNAGVASVKSGAFGNSGINQAAAQEMGNVATSMYGNAYAQDQNNRLQAISQAPTFGNAAYNDAGQLLNAGNLQQQQAQNNLDFGYSQFQDASNYPFKQLQATGNVVQQGVGSTTSGTSTGGGGGK